MPATLRFEIKVFRSSPVWDQYDRWFKVPRKILEELYVCTYEVVNPTDPEDVCPADVERHAPEVHALHPDCVLVY